MRGADGQQAGMFSYVSPERRIPADHPLRPIREMTDAVLRQLSRRFAAALREDGPALDRAGEAAARPAAPGPLLGPQRAAADGAAPVQSPLPLVRRAEHGRPRLGRDRVHEESGAAAARRRGRGLFPAGAGAGAGRAALVRRALLGGRHPDPGLGRAEELRAQGDARPHRPTIRAIPRSTSTGRSGATPRTPRSPTRTRSCSRRRRGTRRSSATSGHVLIENRHGLVVNSRLTRATGRAEWEAAWAMAKEIPGRRRATLGADKHYDDRDFVECLRTLNVTPHVAQKETHRARRADHAPRGLRREPAVPQARRGSVRVVEDRGAVPPDAVPRPRPRRLDVHLRGGGLQLGATADPPGGGCMRRRGRPWPPSAGRRRRWGLRAAHPA